MMSEVPPSMVFACARRKPRAIVREFSTGTGTQPMAAVGFEALAFPRPPAGPSRSIASFWSRWLNSACWSLVIEPPGRPRRRRVDDRPRVGC